MHPLKRLTDRLTWLRVVLAVVILVLTITWGPAALEPGLQLLVVAWISDALDGMLSRRSGQVGRTWIGRHDTLADIRLATVVWILLARSGLVPPLVVSLYLLFWGGIFWQQRGYRVPQPGIFQGIIYAWTIIKAL